MPMKGCSFIGVSYLREASVARSDLDGQSQSLRLRERANAESSHAYFFISPIRNPAQE